MPTLPSPHFAVIDPAMRIAEVECYNRLALAAPLRATYHLPAMWGLQSLRAEDPASLAGIVILGSASSVHDRHAWQIELEAWLAPLVERGIPTLGICYGHQMLAHMLGGRVEYLHADRRKLKGFREVSVHDSPLGPARRGEICVSHNEHVSVAPESMRVLATSRDCAIDGLVHATLPVYSFQPHPEAVPEFLRNHEIPGAGTAAAEAKLPFGQALVDAFLTHAAARLPTARRPA